MSLNFEIKAGTKISKERLEEIERSLGLVSPGMVAVMFNDYMINIKRNNVETRYIIKER